MTNTNGREAAIKGLHQYREELLDQLQEVEKSILKFGGDIEPHKKMEKSPPHDELMTSDLGPQQLVEKYLRDHPGKFFKTQFIAKELIQGGYHPNSPKFWVTQVRNCLRTAVKKGIAEFREDAPGKRRFGLKQVSGVTTANQETVPT